MACFTFLSVWSYLSLFSLVPDLPAESRKAGFASDSCDASRAGVALGPQLALRAGPSVQASLALCSVTTCTQQTM